MKNIYIIQYSFGSIHDNMWGELDDAYSNPFDAEQRRKEFEKEMTSLSPFPLTYTTYKEIKENGVDWKEDSDYYLYLEWLEDNDDKLDFNFARVKEFKLIK